MDIAKKAIHSATKMALRYFVCVTNLVARIIC